MKLRSNSALTAAEHRSVRLGSLLPRRG
jgi:hypothetical protein